MWDENERTENNASYKKMFKKTKPFSSFIGTPYYYLIIKIIIVIICFFLCSFFILLHSHHIFLTWTSRKPNSWEKRRMSFVCIPKIDCLRKKMYRLESMWCNVLFLWYGHDLTDWLNFFSTSHYIPKCITYITWVCVMYVCMWSTLVHIY